METRADAIHRLFDRRLIGARRIRASQAPADFLIERVAEDMADRLALVKRTFTRAADIATPTDAIRRALGVLGLRDIIALEPVEALAGRRARPVVVAEPEMLPFGSASLDLVVSGLALHLVDDLPGTLAQIMRALKPDGLFLACLLGEGTLGELRECFMAAEAEIEGGVSPRIAPFADVRDLGGLLQRAGFALPVTDKERIVVRYPDAFALMRDLRAMGATNPLIDRRRWPLRRATLLRMASLYAERHADPDGRIRATFQLIWVSGWAPHESQQKPLKPGSAKARLAEALNAIEQSAGESTGR